MRKINSASTQKFLSKAALFTMLSCIANPALAATFTWTGAVDNDFHNPQNWDLLAVPDISDQAVFPAGPTNQNIVASQTGSVDELIFNAPGYSFTVPATISFFGLTGTGIGGSENITVFQSSPNTGGFTFYSGSAASTTFINAPGAGIVFSGFSTGGNATITNNGTVTFFNSATGGNAIITTDGGTIRFFNGGTAPNATFIGTGAGGTVQLLGSTNVSVGSLSGNLGVNLNTRTITLGGLNLSDSISGVISGSGGLTKIGSGTLTLTANNTYTGLTTISNGTLTLTGSSASTSFLNNANLIFSSANPIGTATVTNNGNISFLNAATAPNATIISNGAGALTLGGGNVSIGSLSGSAGVQLNGNTLTLGGLNLNDTISGVISGSGGLTKIGSGNLTLTANNTYTGLTTISNGTLTLTGSSASPSFLNSANLDLSGVNSAGSATITSTGNISFLNAATAPNATIISNGAGALTLSGGNVSIGSLSGSAGIQLNNNTLTLGGLNQNDTISGVISGGGGLTKTGSGNLTLTANNIYTGLTTISNGTLTLAGSSASTSFLNNANLVFSNASSIGSATVISNGAGALTLAGGDVSIGSLSGSADVQLNGNTLTLGGLNLNDTISGDISGGGGLTKIGSGHLTLAGAANYTGTTTLTSGELTLGTLSHNAIIAENTTLHAATYAPVAGAALNIGANTATSGLFDVAGAANLANADLTMSFSGGPYTIPTVYTLVNASAVNGTFASVSSNPAMLVPILTYNPTNVQMQVQVLPIIGALDLDGLTSNQISVADVIDDIIFASSVSPEWQDILSDLSILSSTELARAIDTLSPDEQNGTNTVVGNQTMRQIAEMLSSRSRAFVRYAGRGHKKTSLPLSTYKPSNQRANTPFTMLASGNKHGFMDSILSSPENHFGDLKRLSINNDMILSEGKGGMWIQPFGNITKLDSSVNESGYDAKTGGFILGTDRVMNDNILAGAVVGYGRTHLKFSGGIGHSNTNNAFMSLYTTAVKKALHVDALLTGSVNHFEETRNIKFSTISTIAKNRHSGYSLNPHIGAGYDIMVDEAIIEPFVNLDYHYNKERRYTETGAGALNLAVRSKYSTQIQGEVGMRLSKVIQHKEDTIMPEFSLSYINTQPLKKEKMIASFVGQSGTFINTGPNNHRNYISLGASTSVFNNSSGTVLSFGYSANLNNKFSSHQASVGYGIPL